MSRFVLFNLKHATAAVILTSLVVPPLLFAAVIYRIVDHQGRVTYADRIPLDAAVVSTLRVPGGNTTQAPKTQTRNQPASPKNNLPQEPQGDQIPRSASEGAGEKRPVDTAAATRSAGGKARSGAGLGTNAGLDGGDGALVEEAVSDGGLTPAARLVAQPDLAVTNPSEPDPFIPATVGSAGLVPPRCPLIDFGGREPVRREPFVRAEDFGAVGDGVTDDTRAIQKALNSLTGGGTLMLQGGKTYLKRGNLTVAHRGTRVWGYGAVLYTHVTRAAIAAGAGVPKLSIRLVAPETGVYGLTVVSNLRHRLPGHENNAAVVLTSENHEVVDNRFEYTGNGVFVRGGRDFLIARNTVYRTTADGIHVTSFSRDGLIVCNVVRESGDDMIAVVNYGLGEPTIGNFLIEKNDVAGNYWGRGIAVVGGQDVTIRGNLVQRTTHGAGIIVTSEKYWKTAHVRNVLVEDNDIREVQTTDPAYNVRQDFRRTGQGAIDINGQGDQEVKLVLVRNNRISNSARDGLFVRNRVTAIALLNNTMTGIGQIPVRILRIKDEGWVACRGNTKDGAPVEDPSCADVGLLPEVRGASLGNAR